MPEKMHNFDIRAWKETDHSDTAYDYKSVMHYNMFAFSKTVRIACRCRGIAGYSLWLNFKLYTVLVLSRTFTMSKFTVAIALGF